MVDAAFQSLHNQKFVLLHLSEALPRERRSRMASNMYVDPAFSSLAASTGGSEGTEGASLRFTSLRREPGKNWLGLLHGKHTTGCLSESTKFQPQFSSGSRSHGHPKNPKTSSGSWAGILRGCLLQRRRMQ